MSYLLTQMFLYMLSTFILGLILGWLLWRYGRPNSRDIAALHTERDALLKEREDLRVNLDASRTRSADDRSTAERLRAEKIDLQTQLDGYINDRNAVSEPEPEPEAAPEATPRPVRVTSALLNTPDAAPDVDAPVASKPRGLSYARGNKPDDLKEINGIGPSLEAMLNDMGYYHFDQIAAWTPAEEAWVDANLNGFHGRASRDFWIEQARLLAGR